MGNGSVMGKGKRGKRRGSPKVGSRPNVRHPEKYSDCRTDLIGRGGRGGCTCYIFHKGVYRGGHGLSPLTHKLASEIK